MRWRHFNICAGAPWTFCYLDRAERHLRADECFLPPGFGSQAVVTEISRIWSASRGWPGPLILGRLKGSLVYPPRRVPLLDVSAYEIYVSKTIYGRCPNKKFMEGYSPLRICAFRDWRWRRLSIAVYLILFFVCLPERVNVELNRPSPQTIYAPREAIDEYTTELLRKDAAEAVAEVFDYNPAVEEKALATVEEYFAWVMEIRSDPDLSRQEKTEAFRKLGGLALSSSTAGALHSERAIISDLENRLKAALAEVFKQGVKVGGVETAQKQIDAAVALFPFDTALKQVALKLAGPLIEPNMIANPKATAENREAARRAVEPVILQRNTLIVSEGELVSEKQMAQLESLGLLRGKQADYGGIIGCFCFC